MRTARAHDTKSYQRARLVRASHDTAMTILKNAQQISKSHLVAHQGIFTVPFPDTNHPDLELDYSAEPTKASSVLDTLTTDPDSFKVLSSKQSFLHLQKEIRESWQFNATRQNPMTGKEWEIYDTRLRTLIIDHVSTSMSRKNIMDKETKKLLTGGITATDSLSSIPENRMKDSLAAMITPHIRAHFFVCEDDELEEKALQDITWRGLGLPSLPAAPRTDRSSAGEYMKYQRALHANTQAMVKPREYINHCYT